VRNVKVNSIPEKIPRNRKCNLRKLVNMAIRSFAEDTGVLVVAAAVASDPSILSEAGLESVLLTAVLAPSFATTCILVPRVSGRATIKNIVSSMSKIKVKIAGAA